MWLQKEVRLRARARGFHVITDDVLQAIPELSRVEVGLLNVFIKHTSASISINENADPSVRQDFEQFFNRLVPENEPYYRHRDEGPDDIPAHLKASLLGTSVTVPVWRGCLRLGTWQGIYLCEHRNQGDSRCLVLTLNGEKSQD